MRERPRTQRSALPSTARLQPRSHRFVRPSSYLLALLLGVLVAGCEDPADPGIPDSRTSTADAVSQKAVVGDPRDRVLYEVLSARHASHARAVVHLRPASPAELIDAFAQAYGTMNYNLYRSLLADNAPGNAKFLFFLSEPTELGETQWGVTEELRIHQRMFMPESTPEGDPPVPPERWVQNIDINLTQLEPFAERTDLYSQDGGADGKLDSARWRATDARYGTYVYWDMAGEMDYVVQGEENFIVIEDKAKEPREPDKFLLYVWEDLGGQATGGGPRVADQATWSGLKSLYR